MSSLSALHQGAILAGFLDMHRRMAEMESQLVQATTPSEFLPYENDLSAVEREAVLHHFEQIRRQMVACLERAEIPLQARPTSLRWSLECGIGFMQVALADLGPKQLRAYGALDEAGRAAILKIQQEIAPLLADALRIVRQTGEQSNP